LPQYRSSFSIPTLSIFQSSNLTARPHLRSWIHHLTVNLVDKTAALSQVGRIRESQNIWHNLQESLKDSGMKVTSPSPSVDLSADVVKNLGLRSLRSPPPPPYHLLATISLSRVCDYKMVQICDGVEEYNLGYHRPSQWRQGIQAQAVRKNTMKVRVRRTTQ
jgi:hypothetical protein